MKDLAIIEIGSNNTKIHVYKKEKVIFEETVTIEFKKHYIAEQEINKKDLELLFNVIEKAFSFTRNVYVFGCSIFRNITSYQLNNINNVLKEKFDLSINVVSQKDEALLTGFGCFNDISYEGNICIFIGGGGSIELLFVHNKEIIDQKYFDFGVVDVTNHFPSLRENYNTCTFDEVYSYIDNLIGELGFSADILILAGGDHIYWYKNANYQLNNNNLYKSSNQPFMITRELSDQYDRDALTTSLDAIRMRSDNPLWFDGSRAMKVITNVISHKVGANYIVPTKINMEDGILKKIVENQF